MALLNAATAFVFPSLYEGFGLAGLEALACGCPLVTSNVGGTLEVGRGVALLVDPRQSGEIAEAMLRLAADEALRAELRAKGLAKAAKFSYASTARQTRALLGTAAAGRTAGAQAA